ncbi:MAG: hypothetical protein AUJ36_01790 [Parcubacteria group bacterium CG1_02_41_26]|nr:MAG: hypothetical protein AUJ36_01790 [Parcubacteria group bacterium CG1_02_41_26]
MNKYEQNKIKDYQHWTVYVHENQSYLGRCVIACKRAKADDLANASQEELLEFLRIINELKNALQKAFQTDWFNYSFLGNADQHLHCHFIPRYQTERVFEGIVFKDELWGHNEMVAKLFRSEILDFRARRGRRAKCFEAVAQLRRKAFCEV